ncbi:hypothetical protein BDZ91DRAFT_766489 [Kalaharituber pfeilii]|nr:hypothetical protein BDZ91DRAFT_766489 [Kalaharituber pfeilii]
MAEVHGQRKMPGLEKGETFDYSILSSEFFTIMLESDETPEQLAVSDSSETLSIQPNANQKGPLYVHRSLLVSLSPELEKHVYNEMKEGKTKTIVLKDVDRVTMERILEWGYTKQYRTGVDGPASLLIHTRIYVCADRFNIQRLKRLSFAGVKADLRDISCPPTESDIHACLVQIIEYAFGNLCTEDRLLEYFAYYLAWGLRTIRKIPAYQKMFTAKGEVAAAVLLTMPPVAIAPWSVLIDDHVLTRRCKVPERNGCLISRVVVITMAQNIMRIKICNVTFALQQDWSINPESKSI